MPVLALTVADLTSLFLRLLPRGLVWPKSLSFVQPQVIQALMPTYQRLVARDNNLLTDAFPATADELLPEWEASVGLPDPCSGEDATLSQRRAHVVARLTETDGPSVPSLTAYALALGYEITITEFAPSRFGRTFGEAFNGPAWAFAFQITAPALTIRPFPFGGGVFGEPFATWNDSTLACELNRIKPAHTVMLLNYTFAAGAGTGFLLSESGEVLTSESGTPLQAG